MEGIMIPMLRIIAFFVFSTPMSQGMTLLASLFWCIGMTIGADAIPMKALSTASFQVQTEHTVADSDGDGLDDDVDQDDDNDGYLDGEDAFPLNPVEWYDTDADGLGNNGDSDDDGDGIFDTDDKCPLTPLEEGSQTFETNGETEAFCYQSVGSQDEWDAIGGGIRCQQGPGARGAPGSQLLGAAGLLGVWRRSRRIALRASHHRRVVQAHPVDT